MPKAAFEEDGVERIKAKKVISRRHPVKTMFMAAITTPCEEQNFDGKISLIRLSRQHILQQDTYRQKFHQDNEINQLLLDSDWRKLYEDNYNVAKLLTLISDYYELQEDIEETLCLRYVTHAGINGVRTWERMLDHEAIENHIITTQDGNQ